MWSPRTFLSAPIDSLEVFTGILRTVEETLSFPPQCYVCLMAMLPKSICDERDVVKCPSIYRIYCKARGFDVDEWNKAHLDFWDSA
eukprot:5080390-Pyramimonas_sp.AAC.1